MWGDDVKRDYNPTLTPQIEGSANRCHSVTLAHEAACRAG
jgi:hypothetical protein